MRFLKIYDCNKDIGHAIGKKDLRVKVNAYILAISPDCTASEGSVPSL